MQLHIHPKSNDGTDEYSLKMLCMRNYIAKHWLQLFIHSYTQEKLSVVGSKPIDVYHVGGERAMRMESGFIVFI